MEKSEYEENPTTRQGVQLEEMLVLNSVPRILNHSELPDSEMNCNAVENALSNFLVLRNIFLIMEDEDLLISRQVSKTWRAVADLMMSTRYDIQLGKPNFEREEDVPVPWEIDYVLVKIRDRDDRQRFIEFETNFDGAFQTLKGDLQSPKISISVKVEDNVNIRNGLGKYFFSQFGRLVVDLEFTGDYSLPLNTFCKLLLQELPNLKEFKLSELRLEGNSPEDQLFSPDLPQNIHRNLRKISFNYGAGGTWTVETVGKFLKMFPNLETIEQMPLLFIEAVVQAEKGHVIKSLSNSSDFHWEFDQSGETDATAFVKLAQLQCKLTSFHLPPSIYPIETNEFGTLMSSVFPILQSCSVSLKSLHVPPTKFYGIRAIPKMIGLKLLELSDASEECSLEGDMAFFPRDVSLQEIFPNVSDLSLSFEVKLDEHWMNLYLPANVFSPWGSQIKQLKISSMSPDILPLLQRLFPAIEGLQLWDTGIVLTEILLKLPHLWPELKSLAITIDWRPYILDWHFLDLSEDDVAQLRDSSRSGTFTAAEFQEFKDRCIISKLERLKQLKIVLRHCLVELDPVSREIVTRLTPISNQVGFKLLEGLKVTVDICRDHNYFEAIKKELEPLATNGNIQIVQIMRQDIRELW